MPVLGRDFNPFPLNPEPLYPSSGATRNRIPMDATVYREPHEMTVEDRAEPGFLVSHVELLENAPEMYGRSTAARRASRRYC